MNFYIKRIEGRFNHPFKLILLLFVLLFVFVSDDRNQLVQSPLTMFLHEIFMINFLYPGLSIFLFIVLFLSFFIIGRFNLSSKNATQSELVIIWATILYIVFLMINPNSVTKTPFFGLPLFSNPSLYVSLILIISLSYMKKEVFVIFLRKVIKLVLIFSVIRVILLFILWLSGRGNTFLFGVSSILMEEDTLLIFAFLSLLFLLLFTIKKDKRFLILWFLFFAFQLFSFRRSGMLLTLILSSAYFMVFYLKYAGLGTKIFIFFIFISIFFTALNVSIFKSEKSQLYLNRYFGEFFEISDGDQYESISKNAHLDQSLEAMKEGFKGLPFWGFGYGRSSERKRMSFEGNTGIHNAYFQLWENQGLFALFYFAIIIIIVLKRALKLFRNHKKYPKGYVLIKACILFFFIAFMANAWVLIIGNLIGLKMVVFRTFLLASLFKITPANYHLLFDVNVNFNIK